MDRIILKPKEEARIMRGHPWVFDNEISEIIGEPKPGSIVDVESSKKKYLGRGFYNPNSKIRVRLTTRSKEGIDSGYIKRRIKAAYETRSIFLDTKKSSYRLVFAEADLLPGLIVDSFFDGEHTYLSAQFLCYGMDILKNDIVTTLVEITGARGIVERSDASVRSLEGLELVKGILYGTVPDTINLIENNCFFETSLLNAQKTGWFLDQRENREAASKYVQGKTVLDVCTNAGGFSILAAKNGAQSVESIDISEAALELVSRNAEKNNVAHLITTKQGDVFEVLKQYEKDKKKFDVIILDPPAFAKTKANVSNALRGYKEINMRALNILNKNGVLVTCSCSHYISQEMFVTMLVDAANDADRTLKIIESRIQSKDHPILLGYPESFYLKCIIAKAD